MSTTQVCKYQGAEATAQHLRAHCLSQGLAFRSLLLFSPHALTHCLWSSVSAARSTSCPTELNFVNMLDVKYFLFVLYQTMNIMHISVCVQKFYFCFLFFIFISFHLFLVSPAILCPSQHFFTGLRTSAMDIIITSIPLMSSGSLCLCLHCPND